MNIQDLDLRQLITFREVAACRSFGRAAASLGFTQSAVSQQIARLEEVLGQSLFHRPGGPKQVELTVAAELLLPRVDDLVAQLRAIRRDFDGFSEGTVGKIAVGTFQSVSVRLLPAVVTILSEERPNLRFEMRESTSGATLKAALKDHELDLMFWVDEEGDWEGFDKIPLFEDDFFVVAAVGDALDEYRPEHIAALPMVGHDRSDLCQARIDAGLRNRGVEPRYVFRSADNAAVQAMVRAGQGIAIMPRLSIDSTDPGIVVRDLQPALPPRTVVIVVRAGESRSPAVERFIEIAVKESERLLATV